MRLASYQENGKIGLAASLSSGSPWHGVLEGSAAFPGSLDCLLAKGENLVAAGQALLQNAPEISLEGRPLLPPVRRPGKLICLGLNYADHVAETGKETPRWPDVFLRLPNSFCGHNQPMIKPFVSEQFDWEGELAMVIGKGGRNISREKALEHVAGYAVFNDGSVRDFQLRVSQWCVGKNFDNCGAFGPWLVTADSLPAGARGLGIETRINGRVMQKSNTGQLIFDIPAQIAYLSQAMTLEPGDVFITGTPSGVGLGQNPPSYLKAGDVCEVEIESIGLLKNVVEQD